MTITLIGAIVLIGCAKLLHVIRLPFLPPTLDRVWLWLITVSALVILPLWAVVLVQDFGFLNVTLFALACVVFGMWRAWPTS